MGDDVAFECLYSTSGSSSRQTFASIMHPLTSLPLSCRVPTFPCHHYFIPYTAVMVVVVVVVPLRPRAIFGKSANGNVNGEISSVRVLSLNNYVPL